MDIAKRFECNPLLTPSDATPSLDCLTVECLLNPAVFEFDGKIHLLVRVAERREQEEGVLSTVIADETAAGGIRDLQFKMDDPKLDASDMRIFYYDGLSYLTTMSHLRLATSEDGRHFTLADKPTLLGIGPLETFGIEDCRVGKVDDTFYLTYTAVSESGVGLGLRTTKDWRNFEHHGMILPPHNKDCAIFDGRVDGGFACLHRPSGAEMGGHFIWYSTSPDAVHWGKHRCLMHTRKGKWDEQRIGAGGSPIKTEKGWLEIYHGANRNHRYCLGAALLDLDDPSIVLARSDEPIMEPVAEYEQKGFFGNVVFTNGHIVRGDEILMYYGASDTVICGATLSISEILRSLGV